MICSNCGNEFPDGSKFCQRCGKKVNTTLVEKQNKVEFPPIDYEKEIHIPDTADRVTDNNLYGTSEEITGNTGYATPGESVNKESYCKKCAQPLPEGITLCPACGFDNKEKESSSKTKKISSLLAAAVAILLICGIVQVILFANIKNKTSDAENGLYNVKNSINYVQQEESSVQQEIDDTNYTVSSVRSSISDTQDAYDKAKNHAEIYDEFVEAAKGKNIGYGSSDFYANKGFFYISRYESASFEITTKYSGTTTVTKKTNGYSATVTYDSDFRSTGGMTITPESEGVTTVDFTNNKDNSTFRIIIIVY